MSQLLTQKAFVSVALAAAADRYDSDPATDIYSTRLYEIVTFIIMHGAGGTGTVIVTVQKCTDNAGAGATAIPFRYRVGDADGVDLGAFQDATVAGFTLGPAADQIAVIEVLATELQPVAPLVHGHEFVRLLLTEGVDDPVSAAVLAICGGPSYAGAVMSDATV